MTVWEPWGAEAAKAAQWRTVWGGKAEAEQSREVRELVAGLKGGTARALAETREKLLLVGAELPALATATFAPEEIAGAPQEAALKDLLRDLDSEDFSTRSAARKKLSGYGRSILPWVERTLKDRTDLSAEVRASLEWARTQAKSLRESLPDDGRERAVMILLELEPTEAVKKALLRYADGPETSPASRLARRALGR